MYCGSLKDTLYHGFSLKHLLHLLVLVLMVESNPNLVKGVER